MDPITAVLALYALSKVRPRNPELVAYAIPAKGLGIVTLPHGNKLVLGNGYAYEANWTGKSIVRMYYGNNVDAIASLAMLEDPALAHELMTAKLVSDAGAIVIKYKTSVWVIDNVNASIIATVDKGHFLGQNLLGSKEAASALIANVLKLGVNLDPAQAVVGIRVFT